MLRAHDCPEMVHTQLWRVCACMYRITDGAWPSQSWITFEISMRRARHPSPSKRRRYTMARTILKQWHSRARARHNSFPEPETIRLSEERAGASLHCWLAHSAVATSSLTPMFCHCSARNRKQTQCIAPASASSVKNIHLHLWMWILQCACMMWRWRASFIHETESSRVKKLTKACLPRSILFKCQRRYYFYQ